MKYGVYKITNRINSHIYIGSSANQARQGVHGRLRDHRTDLIAGRHSNCVSMIYTGKSWSHV